LELWLLLFVGLMVHLDRRQNRSFRKSNPVDGNYIGRRANQKDVEMRGSTLAMLTIAALSMTTAQADAGEYRCLTPSGYPARCVVDPHVAAHSPFLLDGILLDGRRHFVWRGPHSQLGPNCTTYSMWSWPFTC